MGCRSRRRLLSDLSWLLGTAALPNATLASPGQPLRTLRAGRLRVGTYFVNPPFEFLAHGRRVGFEIDLMHALARRLGLRTVFVDTQWEVILHEMQDGRFDCIVGGITITADRRRILDWSTPYLTTTLSLIVDAGRSSNLAGLSDLKAAVVGVQAATTDYDVAVRMQRQGEIAGIRVYSFARISEAITDLAAGRLGAVMKVRPVAEWLVRTTPGLRILAQVPDDPQPLGIGFAKGNVGLLAAVDRNLSAIRRDGDYDQIAKQWGIA
jgi:ABC-type amino acid transport substrate-binding protein